MSKYSPTRRYFEKGAQPMTLNARQANCVCRIEALDLPAALGQRLEALGMTSGSPVHVVRNKSRGTMIVKIRGSRFAIGRDISQNIRVQRHGE